MRSRQINFYLTAADEAELVRRFARRGEYAVLASNAQGRRPELLESAESGKTPADRMQIFLAQTHDVEAVILKKAREDLWYIDVLRSPVVEFDRCRQTKQKLGRGRLYFVTSYFDEQVVVSKDRSFVEWATGFIKIARRTLKKDPASFFYFGEEAFRLKEAGVELSLL